ncbi:MAG: tetratricopeptide repeat protein [Actinomycetes bacterium]
MTKNRLMSFSVALGLAGVLTAGAALLPARGSDSGDETASTAAASAAAFAPTQDLQGEIDQLRSRVDAQPADARTWAVMALLLIEQARATVDPTYYGQAQSAIDHSFEVQPHHNDVALAARAAMLSAQHRFTAALETARSALRIDPYSASALGVRVDALTELVRLPEALHAARQFDQRQPGLAATTRLAYQAELRGNDDLAHDYFRDALHDAVDATTRAFVEFHLGELARRAGRLTAADHHYRAALQSVPSDPSATAGLAKIDALRGKNQRAIRTLTELVSRVPLPEHLISLGELYLLQGDKAAARAQFKVVRASAQLARANGIRPDLELSWFESDHGNAARALSLAKSEWRKRQPPMVADALAWALHQNGHDAAALHYARLATAFGGDARSWHHRGVIEASLGMDAAAREHLRRALEVDAGYSPWPAQQLHKVLVDLRASS